MSFEDYLFVVFQYYLRNKEDKKFFLIWFETQRVSGIFEG